MQISPTTPESDLLMAAYAGGMGAPVEAQIELQRRYTERTAIATERYARAAETQAAWTKAVGWFTLVLTLSSIAQVVIALVRH